MTVDTNAFDQRRDDLAREVEAMRVRLDGFHQQLADEVANELLNGKSTTKSQAQIRASIESLEGQMAPKLKTLAEAERLRHAAQRATAEAIYAAATSRRQGLFPEWRAQALAIREALVRIDGLNRQLGQLEDADEESFYAQKEAAGMLGAEPPRRLPATRIEQWHIDRILADLDAALAQAQE